MPFTLTDSLIDSQTVSRYFYGVDDAVTTGECSTTQEKFYVEFAVNAASQQIKTYCARQLSQQTYSEVWDGQASDVIIPREYPIQSITSIKYSGNNDFSTADSLPTGAYAFDEEYITLLGDAVTPRGRGLIQVVYSAGYSPVPYDIQQACLMQAQYLFKMQGKEGGDFLGLSSIGKMGETATKDSSIGKTGLAADVIGILSPYKRMDAPLSVMFTRVS
jgi:hypothetical protein